MESLGSYIELRREHDYMESIMVHFRFPQASSMRQGRKKKKMMMTTNR
jgi:hypothetical protein